MVDEKTLTSLLKQNSETAVRRFLMAQLDKMNIPFQRDGIGNLFSLRYKNKPLLSAHMDFIKYQNPEIKSYKQYIVGKSLGCDDKIGIFIILMILETIKVNFVFSVGEEIGGKGIRYFLKNNKLDVPYALVLDRKGSSDILCTRNFYGTKEFENALLKIGKPFGFKPNRGTFCDGNFIRDYISCANLSIGYYHAHSPVDYVDLQEMVNTYEFVKKVVLTLKRKFDKMAHRELKLSWAREMDYLNREWMKRPRDSATEE